MGIHDRDYYRKEGPSYLEALIPSGQVCKWLIGINVVVWILQLVSNQGVGDRSLGTITDWLLLDTEKVLGGQVWRLLSYAFLHTPFSPWHILFNMLFLWMLGSELERMYGSREFLSFYLIAALAGGVAYQVQAMVQGTPMYCLGASGAVTAVMVLYAFHFPNVRVLLFFVLPVPIWGYAIFQVIQDTYHLFGPPTAWKPDGQGSVAAAVHLGGAAFGFLYYKFDWRLLDLFKGLHKWRKHRSQPRLRVYRPDEEEPVPVTAKSSHPDLDEHLDAKLDAVLEKLGRHGRDSLTQVERDILMKASEIYKKKRT